MPNITSVHWPAALIETSLFKSPVLGMPWGKEKESEEKVHSLLKRVTAEKDTYRKNLHGYPKAGCPVCFFFSFFFFTVPRVVSARVFTLAHSDNLVICLSLSPKCNVFLNTDYLLLFPVY